MLNSLNTLGVLNRVMLDLRIQARQASPTAFHQLVHAFFSLQCLVQCYTQNFDGLQTKDHPEMEPMVYEIHGSNMQLKCRVCHSTVPGHTEAFDRSLANENPVECPHCLQHASQAKLNNKRSRPVGYLAPAILFNQESAAGKDGQDYHKMLEKHGRATKLLLIAGTSLMTPGTACMARSLAGWVHRGKGLVVYVNRQPLAASWEKYIDLHLETELGPWATMTMRDIREIRNKAKVKKFEASASAAQLKTLVRPGPDSGLPRPTGTTPNGQVTLRRQVIRLHIIFMNEYFTKFNTCQMPTAPGPSAANVISTRVTRDRSPPAAEPLAFDPAPPASTMSHAQKVLTVVLYHGDVAEEASTVGREVTSWLSRSGWETTSCIRKLYDPVPIETPFQRDEFHLLLVHITDYVRALAGKDGSAWEGDDIFELLAVGRKRAKKLFAWAISCQAILVCSGEHLLCAKEARGLETGVQKLFNCHNVLVCSGLRFFKAADWARFIAEAEQSLLQSHDESVPELVKAWMRNEPVFSSSNLIWFSSCRPTLLLLASPFQTHPCGRPLPDINSACGCSEVVLGHPRVKRKTKRWIVQHNCDDGTAVEDAVVTAECSWCGQKWSLRTGALAGIVCKIGDSFSVVAPYFF
ncbi:hypothetical protein FS749_016457 [Ceratobasidium sp. UAMH 11750]|nr:hypothetical protein FS749_016457 [Ceratobasidium sp. UAMH 11750]